MVSLSIMLTKIYIVLSACDLYSLYFSEFCFNSARSSNRISVKLLLHHLIRAVNAFVDPLKEQNAQMNAVRCGFKSRAEVVSELGYDVEEIDEEIFHDNERAKKMGLRFDSTMEVAE